MFPAQPATPPAQAQARGSKAPLVGLGLLVVVGGIVAIVLATRGGGGGGDSPKALVEDALAAISAGDADKLAKLADTDHLFKTFVTCDPNRADDTAEQLAEREKKSFARAVEKAKGLKVALVEFPDIDKLDKDQMMTMPKGSELAKGCTANADATLVDTKMKVSVQDGDKPAVEEQIAIALFKLDGRWYLSGAPKIERHSDASDQIAKMSELRDRMCACKDAACATKVAQEASEWGSHTSERTHNVPYSAEDSEKIGQIMTATAACLQKAAEGGAGDDLPEGCKDWKAGIDKLDACPKIPRDAIATMRGQYERSAASWKQISAEKRATMSHICDRARDAVAQAIKEEGCE
jgi:hypothetical protein